MNQLAKSFLFVGIVMIAASPAFAALTVSHLSDSDLPGAFNSQVFVGEGRAGDGAATATYEVGVGGTMGASTVVGNYTWVSGAVGAFGMVYDAGTDCKGNVGGGELLIKPVVSSVVANGTAMSRIRDDDLVYGPAFFFESVTGMATEDIEGPLVGN